MKKLIALLLLISTNCFACEFLILNRSDLPVGSKWEKGDVIVVMPDGHEWGNEELKTEKFIIIQTPNMSVENGRIYTVSVFDVNKNIIKLRKYKVDTKDMVETKTKIELVDIDKTMVDKTK